MMKFVRSSWESYHIWTVLRIQHVDGVFEEEGSVCHLQLLQGVVTWTIMLVVLENLNNDKTSIEVFFILFCLFCFSFKKKWTQYTLWSVNQKVFLLRTCAVYIAPGSKIYSLWSGYTSNRLQITTDYEATRRICLRKSTVMLTQNQYGQYHKTIGFISVLFRSQRRPQSG